jgi:hypothetical protein
MDGIPVCCQRDPPQCVLRSWLKNHCAAGIAPIDPKFFVVHAPCTYEEGPRPICTHVCGLTDFYIHKVLLCAYVPKTMGGVARD